MEDRELRKSMLEYLDALAKWQESVDQTVGSLIKSVQELERTIEAWKK